MATDHGDALDKLGKLKDGWLLKSGENPEGAEPSSETGMAPAKDAVKAAREFIEQGAFYPTPAGGVQWESKAGDWDLVITFNAEGGATVIYS